MAEREVWIVEDCGDPQLGNLTYSGIPTLMGHVSRAALAAALSEDCYQEAVPVRYVPAPEWRTGEPEKVGNYWCEFRLNARETWDVSELMWLGYCWRYRGCNHLEVRRYTDIPQPPPWEEP